ncbi:MAG: mechanosensitive ion channel family protein [Acidimicrobiales bacterium]
MSLPEALSILAGCLVGGYIIQAVGIALAVVIARRRRHVLAQASFQHLKGPVRILLPFMAMAAALPEVRLPGYLRGWFDHGAGVVIILAIAWLAIRLISVAEDVILEKHTLVNTGQGDTDKAQRIHTQVRLLRSVVAVIILVIAVGAILMSFGKVRTYGASLLASAGIIGIVVGLAAQPIMTNLLAGAQIGIAQPFRVDDVVVINGHWGRIEEISLTYVVVRVWDLRRLVLPISWFVQNPFENWTRSGADLLSYVHLEVDYRAPIEEIRNELHRVLKSSPRWSGSVWNLQVTGAGPSTLQVRALMGARNSQDGWDLQCEVREKLIGFLQGKHPEALPRIRLEGEQASAGTGGGEEVGTSQHGDAAGDASGVSGSAGGSDLSDAADDAKTRVLPTRGARRGRTAK